MPTDSCASVEHSGISSLKTPNTTQETSLFCALGPLEMRQDGEARSESIKLEQPYREEVSRLPATHLRGWEHPHPPQASLDRELLAYWKKWNGWDVSPGCHCAVMELTMIALVGAMLSSVGKQRDERLQEKSESQFLLAVLTLHRASVLR